MMSLDPLEIFVGAIFAIAALLMVLGMLFRALGWTSRDD